ncbi:hypothetical protein [Nocardioides sp. R-C-SC26]|uniref:hypothetical protein n=1 Tax=Nocardioides sp. R-C-SC26 TaxID=2870414 RepID=UPI001E4CC062|nr:hypothetical protein [Nocardioides sp. R-C-SC26]
MAPTRSSRASIGRLALILTLAATAIGLSSTPAQAAQSRLQVFVGGGQMFISPPSADNAIDSRNDVLVDLYRDRIEITERSPEATLEIHPAAETGCAVQGAKVVCTQSVTAVSVLTKAGADRIVFDQPQDDSRTLNADCGDGDDALHAARTGAAALLGDVVSCETRSDELPDDSEPVQVDPFGVSEGLVVVPLPKVTGVPYCAGRNPKKCGSFTFWTEAKARQRLKASGLNYQLNVKYVTTYTAAQKILKQYVTKGVVTNTSNIADGDILEVKEVLYDEIYRRHKVDRSKFRASTLNFPYVVSYTVYLPPVPDPPSGCPYATGIYTDIDPSTKGQQRYDVKKELLGTSRAYAVDALTKRFKCPNVDIKLFPVLNNTADVEAVRDVKFRKAEKRVTLELNVPARPDLILQLSGRSRTFWLDSPANADLFDAELGPLVDGRFALAPNNRTTVNVRLFERVTGKSINGLGTVMVIDDDGDLVAEQTATGAGDTTLTFPVKDTTELWFVGTIKAQGGRLLTSFARRAVVDTGPMLATARGAVFTHDAAGVYVRNTQASLLLPDLQQARDAVNTARELLRGAPDGTSAGQARDIIETNQGLILSKPTAILRHIHEQTGFELGSLHAVAGGPVTDASLDTGTPGGIVIVPTKVAPATGVEGGSSTGVRPAASGVPAAMTGPLVSALGGNSVLGHEAGGFIANGRYIVDLGPAPPAARQAAARGFGDWFSGLVRLVSSSVGKLGTSLQRAAAAVVDGAAQVARSFTGGATAPSLVTVNGRSVILPPTFSALPGASSVNAGTTPAAQIKGQPLAPTQRLRDATGLIANDGTSLIANDGTSLMPKLANALIANDGSGLIANDGSGLIANDGAGLLANDGASYRAAWGTTLISDHGAGLIANDGAGIVSNHSTGIVAGGAGN